METKTNIKRLMKGINQSIDPLFQPQGSYRFALNAVNKTRDGDNGILSHEEGVDTCTNLPTGQELIGSVHLVNDETALFSVNPSTELCMIGIMTNCEYKLYASGELGFKLSNQVDASFRVRNGCDKIVYFVDGSNNLRYYNFDKPYLFHNESGNLDPNKLNLLQRDIDFSYFKINTIDGGNLPIGSIRVGIRYVTGDGLERNVTSISGQSNIYSDNLNSSYHDIEGSDNGFKDTDVSVLHNSSQISNKSLSIDVLNIDTGYDFYQLIFFIKDSDQNIFTKALVTAEISTSQSKFIFNGYNYRDEIDPYSVAFNAPNIYAPKHIEQNNNRLLVANTKGKDYDVCGFQRNSSDIRVSYVTKLVPSEVLKNGNVKEPDTPTDSMTFMADEVYALGIVYVFADGYETPVYNIPGRAPNAFDLDIIAVWSENIRHLYSDESAYNALAPEDKLKRWEVENTGDAAGVLAYWESETGQYNSKDKCIGLEYWGRDINGDDLLDQKVRHHKMPSRNLVPLVVNQSSVSATRKVLKIDITFDPGVISCEGTVEYLVNGVLVLKRFEVFKTNYELVYYNADQNMVVGDVIVTFDAACTGGASFVTFDDEVNSVENSADIQLIGLDFSNIVYPDIRIVGHYIVAGERDSINRTIHDKGFSGELRKNDNYVSFSWFQNRHDMDTWETQVTNHAYGLYPKFNFDNDYGAITHMEVEGIFECNSNEYYSTEVKEDVMDGTSSKGLFFGLIDVDDDGMDWILGFRWGSYMYTNNKPVNNIHPIVKSVKLKPYSNVSSYLGTRKLYNTTSDMKVSIMELGNDLEAIPDYALRYVSYKTSNDVYPDPFNITYRKIGHKLDVGSSMLFGGDCYISKTSHTASTYYKTEVPSRWWEAASNILSIVVVTALTILTAGAAAAAIGVASSYIVATAIAVAVVGISAEIVSEFMKDMDNHNLWELVHDNNMLDAIGNKGKKDDLFKYMGSHVSNLFVESEIPVGLRSKLGNPSCQSFYSKDYSNVSNLKDYFTSKYILHSEERKKPTLAPIPCQEIFLYNKDYLVTSDALKPYNSLPWNFDCCSDCIEVFPQRVHYSEQSFSEGYNDNFSSFKPNNYRDISGEYGVITDLWTLSDNLYVHTENMLYMMPENIQEKATHELTIYIGTGNYFSLPEKKVNDDTLGNMGSIHKWTLMKNQGAVFFLSYYDKKVYSYTAKGSAVLSDMGLREWFFKHIPFHFKERYENYYPKLDIDLMNNNANKYGIGYHAIIDERYNRYILTKRDYAPFYDFFDPTLINCKGKWLHFPNQQQQIDDKVTDGWTYLGITEDCQMTFVKEELVVIDETTKRYADVHVFNDYSGSFSEQDNLELADNLNAWAAGNLHPASQVINYTEDELVASLGSSNDSAKERYLQVNKLIEDYYGAGNWQGRDLIVIVFINEARADYHTSLPNLIVTQKFQDDYDNFVNFRSQLNSFAGVIYPILPNFLTGNGTYATFLAHSILAVNNFISSAANFDALHNQSPMSTNFAWNEIRNKVVGNHDFDSIQLGSLGWAVKSDVNKGSNPIITESQFEDDINLLVEDITTTRSFYTKHFCKIPGVERTDTPEFRCDWTLSYSLDKEFSWISWHTYAPFIYIMSKLDFYSSSRTAFIAKHNLRYMFARYNARPSEFIVEYVILSNAIENNIIQDISYHADSESFHTDGTVKRDRRHLSFTKFYAYNEKQFTGVLNLSIPEDNAEWHEQGVTDDIITIDLHKKEGRWMLNDFRDLVVDYDVPLFLNDCSIINTYGTFIDKIPNPAAMPSLKNWDEQGMMRGKYLIVRLIHHNWNSDVRITLKTLFDKTQKSER